jgi:hypothetical protein
VLAVAIVVAGGTVWAGCGGSAAKAPSLTSSSAGRTLVASADGICRRLNSRLAASEPASHSKPAGFARNAFAHAALERQTLTELSRLSPPPAFAGDWARLLAYRRTLAAELVASGHEWAVYDKKSLLKLATAKARVHVEMFQLAHKAGFTACALVGPSS